MIDFKTFFLATLSCNLLLSHAKNIPALAYYSATSSLLSKLQNQFNAIPLSLNETISPYDSQESILSLDWFTEPTEPGKVMSAQDRNALAWLEDLKNNQQALQNFKKSLNNLTLDNFLENEILISQMGNIYRLTSQGTLADYRELSTFFTKELKKLLEDKANNLLQEATQELSASEKIKPGQSQALMKYQNTPHASRIQSAQRMLSLFNVLPSLQKSIKQ